jgi:histidine triad (HIT) family protein
LFPIPVHYDCPFCKVASGEGDHITYPSDIVYQDDHTTAFISPKWWVNNHGYVIIIPNRHYQDIFDLPPDITSCIHSTAQKISRAFVELYNCDGISTRQHNGAYPMQEVFHYHFHEMINRFARHRKSVCRMPKNSGHISKYSRSYLTDTAVRPHLSR